VVDALSRRVAANVFQLRPIVRLAPAFGRRGVSVALLRILTASGRQLHWRQVHSFHFVIARSRLRKWTCPAVFYLEQRMSNKPKRDIEKDYPVSEFVAKLRRLADALEASERFEIQIAGERIYIPVRAQYNIEHERQTGSEEVEFQIKWRPA
jgi:amphi-Trp domain-containing protein